MSDPDRSAFRQSRRAIGEDQRHSLQAAIHDTLTRRAQAESVRRLAAYWPNDGEPDLRPWLQHMQASGTVVALPVLAESGALAFRTWEPIQPLESNRFGIPEPVSGTTVDPADCDWLLLPLVAFDAAGNRLGMGGGFYDRTLAPLAGSTTPLRIGVAFECQRADSIPPQPWDIPLHAVVTENGWFTFPA